MQRQELKGIMIAEGKSQVEVAKALGISIATFNRKINSGHFGSDEIDILIDYLNIKDPMWIFFDRKVTFKDTKEIEYVKEN